MSAKNVTNKNNPNLSMAFSYPLRDVLPPARIDLVAIGVSTGGPEALCVLVQGLDPQLDCPIVIALHQKEGYSQQLAEQIGKRTSLRVVEAKNSDVTSPGVIYLCPGGKHMVLKRNTQPTRGGLFEIKLLDTPPVNECRPSVDVLFSSVAECTKRNVIAVMMTGIGYDGAMGAQEIVEKASGYVIIQNKATSVVWGMPEAVAKKGIVNEVLPLELIGPRISKLVLGR